MHPRRRFLFLYQHKDGQNVFSALKSYEAFVLMTELLPKEWQIKKQVRTEQNIPLVFHSMGSRRGNLGSILKTVLIRIQLATWLILKLSLTGLSFSSSSTCCFTALAPIPALHTTQWGPEVLSAARSSQADDFGEQGKGRCSPLFPSMLVQCVWVGYWNLTPLHTKSQILLWLCLSLY